MNKKWSIISVATLALLGTTGIAHHNANADIINQNNVSNHTINSGIKHNNSTLIKGKSSLSQNPSVNQRDTYNQKHNSSNVEKQTNKLYNHILSNATKSNKNVNYKVGSKVSTIQAIHSHHRRKTHIRHKANRLRRHYQLKHRKHYKKNGVKRYRRVRKHHIKLSHRKYRNRYAKKHLRNKNLKRKKHLKKNIKRQNKVRKQISHKYNLPSQKTNNINNQKTNLNNNQKQNMANNATNQQSNTANNTTSLQSVNNQQQNNSGNIQNQANQMHSQIVNNNANDYMNGKPLVTNQQVTPAYTSALGVHVPAGYKAIDYNGHYYGDARGNFDPSDSDPGPSVSSTGFPQSNIVPIGAGYMDLTQAHKYPYYFNHNSDSDASGHNSDQVLMNKTDTFGTPAEKAGDEALMYPSTYQMRMKKITDSDFTPIGIDAPAYSELEPKFPLVNENRKSKQQLEFEHNPMINWTPQQFDNEYNQLKLWGQQLTHQFQPVDGTPQTILNSYHNWQEIATSFVDAAPNLSQSYDISKLSVTLGNTEANDE